MADTAMDSIVPAYPVKYPKHVRYQCNICSLLYAQHACTGMAGVQDLAVADLASKEALHINSQLLSDVNALQGMCHAHTACSESMRCHTVPAQLLTHG